MSYIQVSFKTNSVDTQAILIAMLSEHGFEGFEEQEEALVAFLPAEQLDEMFLNELASQFDITYQKQNIENQNWNAKWEENFHPVIIDDFCSITAHFHKININTQHHIRITPKMSFGTGHHATTKQMIQAMRHIDFKSKKVFDFGTGTGVLAILADQLGAAHVLAIDNDEWSYSNAKDNVETNNADNVVIQQAVLDDLAPEKYNVILANINRHILLQYMQQMKDMLNENGELLMSGLLTEDEGIIVDAAKSTGLHLVQKTEENNWIALLFRHK
ncbi:MAG: 50S ribosomal protein L11 methyltransferase [Sphingobacteriales bacterium]|nr:MAG: 50S ribosomal protein L11 methyltransferase [Sphingobacteriales bacterium]